MTDFTIHTTFGNFRTHAFKIAADIAGVKYAENIIEWKDIKNPNVNKNPLGQIPSIETKEGFIFESTAIMRYIARMKPEANLYGKNAHENALVDQFLDYINCDFGPGAALIKTHLGWVPSNKETNKPNHDGLVKILKFLNSQVKGKSFIVGDNLTIADLYVFQVVNLVFRVHVDEGFRKNQCADLQKYIETIGAMPAVVKYWGRIQFAKKEWPLWNKLEEKKPEKKAEKPAPAAKKEEKKEEKKDVNPLDLLPETKFNLFDFKTLITNAPDKREALKFLWENIDKQGFSIWKVEYQKAEGEGKIVYQTNNLYRGFLQRLENFRKYCYGIMGVYGEEPELEIRGVFLWRSTGKPAEVTEHPSYEWHTFTQLSFDKAEDRQVFEDYLVKVTEDEDVVEGLRVRDCKYFK